jgi:hypothetical protein
MERAIAQRSQAPMRDTVAMVFSSGSLYSCGLLTTQRNPTWLVEVSIGCA